MNYQIYFISNPLQAAKLLKCLRHPDPELQNSISFQNKYFECTVDVHFVALSDLESLPKPSALVFVLNSHEEAVHLQKFEKFLEEIECGIVFKEGEHDPDIEDISISLGLEYVYDDLDNFTEFQTQDSEAVGVARVKEALECVIAPYANMIKPATLAEPDIEEQLDHFEYFLNRIRVTTEQAHLLTDDERRTRAEETIKELIDAYGLDEDI